MSFRFVVNHNQIRQHTNITQPCRRFRREKETLVACRKQQSVTFLAVMLCVAAIGRAQVGTSPNESSTKQTATNAKSSIPSTDTSGWKSYRDEKHGFEVRYPETWTVHASSGTGAEIVSIGKRRNGDEANVSLTLAIQKNQNPKQLSIEKWFAEQIRMLNASPESSGYVTLGGQPAAFMENSNTFGKQRDTFTLLHSTDVLSLSYKRQAEFDATYAAILASFRILK